ARIALAQNDSSSTDATVASLLDLANNDTATGNQITVTDALKITGTNVTNGLNLSGTFGTNLITSTNFTVTQAGAATLGSNLTLPSGGEVNTASGNLTFQPAGSGTTASVQIGAANGGAGSATPDILVLDRTSGSLPSGVSGAVVVDSGGKFNVYENGAWKVLCNSTDQACGTGTGSALSAITNAAGANSIGNGDHAQTWNWTLTTASKTAFTFGESAAATNGAGAQFILKASTASGSTATPFFVENAGDALSLRVDDAASDSTPFVIDAAGQVGVGLSTPATKLDVTGLTLNTDADGKVMAANFTGDITKNDANTRTFHGVKILPTLNTGVSNTTTTFNVLSLDTTNTGVTGLTTNLIRAAYGGSQKLLLDSSGNLTLAGNLTLPSGGEVNSTSGNIILQPAGSGTTARVLIGAGNGGAGSTTPDILGLDVKDLTGDPAGFDGAMYYNQGDNKFRCYENGAWADCIATSGSSAWSSLTDPVSDLTLNHAASTTTFNCDSQGNADYLTLSFDNDGSTAGTDRVLSIVNAVSSANTGDANTEALLLLDNADTSASGSTTVDNAILITASGDIATTAITDAIDVSDPDIVNALVAGANDLSGTSWFITGSSGAAVFVGVNSGSGLIQGTGGLTVTGTTNINSSGAAATTIGNASADLALADAQWSITGPGVASFAGLTSTGNVTLSGAQVLGASPLVFEGATDNDITTILAITDPTVSNKTITFPNASGTVAVSATSPITLSALGDIGCATCLASGGTLFTITDGTTPQTIDQGNTLTFADGTDTDVVASATDTVTVNNTSTLATVTGRGATTTTLVNLDGGLAVDTSNFTVSGTTGATAISSSVTTADALAVTATSLTTGQAFQATASSNTAANTAWSQVLFSLTNAQGTTAVSSGSIAGVDLQFTQASSIAGNTETAARIALAQNDSSSTDATVASLLDLANNDTATGNQITVTDALKITGTNVTNGLNFSGTFGTNLITSTNFTVTQAGDITTAGDLNVNGDNINSDGALEIATSGSNNLTFQPAGSGTTARVLIGAGNGGAGSATPDLLGLDVKDLTGDPTGFDGAMYYNQGDNKFRCYENGAWADCISTSGSSALSAITAAAGVNSINNGDNAQTWNWALTTASQTAFTFGENTAAINGVGAQFVLAASTLANSTATPLFVNNLGDALS
ncbi:MAG: hypothetical protein U1C53_01185, partial [Candidatus Veblenbacteria bacterium]|nr:hypothetical protein [Candidatus Veblenbacteria bacterium]